MISKEELEKLYLVENKSQTEIGEIFNCDRKNIDYYLRKYGIPKRSLSECQRNIGSKYDGLITLAELLKMVSNGFLLTEIAKIKGVGRSYLHKMLKGAGINLRNWEEQRKRQSEMMKERNPVPRGSKRGSDAVKNALTANAENFNKRKANVKDFKTYAKMARHMAYKLFKEQVKGKGLVVDHKFSILDGFKNNVPIDVISHKYNLRLITQKENLSKGSKSIISIDEIYKGSVFNDYSERK